MSILTRSRSNPLRSIARRAWRAASIRSDVRIEQLTRQIAVLEELTHVSDQISRVQPRFQAALSPEQDPHLALERIGSEFDGGYVLPRALIQSSAGVVSIGIGTNNDADIALASHGKTIHAWDHTVQSLPRNHDLITFHAFGVGTNNTSTLKTLECITKESFGDSACNLILLMDVEGSEWEVLSMVSDVTLSRYSVLGLELHNLGDSLLPQNKILDVLEHLRYQFVPVVVHANNHGTAWASGGFVLPDILEVTYVRSDLLSQDTNFGNCPENLIARCCPDLPEVHFNWGSQCSP